MTTFMAKPQEKANARRREIVTAILNNMTEVDYQDITISSMCQAAGISVGSFYHYFGDKAGIIPETFAIIDGHIEENLIPALQDENELQNYIDYCHGIGVYISGLSFRQVKFTYEFVQSFSSEDENARPFFYAVRDIIRRGQAKKQIPPQIDANQIARTTVIMLRGHCFDWVRHEGTYDLVEYIDFFAELFVQALVRG